IAGWLRDTGKGLQRCALHDDEYHKSVFASSQWGVFGELIMKIGQPLPDVNKPSIEENFNTVSAKTTVSLPDPLIPSGPKFNMPGPGGGTST
ncbi:MAG: hypothetical protein IT558_02385, partial [Alphaproteobacteria bacterium]|nr:hypothetical protein [Alphaproteobacteria bacterium]